MEYMQIQAIKRRRHRCDCTSKQHDPVSNAFKKLAHAMCGLCFDTSGQNMPCRTNGVISRSQLPGNEESVKVDAEIPWGYEMYWLVSPQSASALALIRKEDRIHVNVVHC